MASPSITNTYRRHWTTLRARYGERVRYTAGDLVIVGTTELPLKAVPARVDGQQVSLNDASTVTSRSQDWLFDPAELVDENGDQIEPKHGHQIERLSDDGTIVLETYRVQPTDTAEDVWRWSEGTHTWRRVHSERVGDE